MTIVTYQHAVRADRGGRERQEDSCAIRFQQRVDADGKTPLSMNGGELIAVLADGMGGHAGGARASKAVCTTFLDSYSRLDGNSGERLVHALDASNRALSAMVDEDVSLLGMGSTLLTVSVDGDGARWISVGDSLLYLFRRSRLIRLNDDHSLAPILDELAERGEISASEANHHPKRGMLRSAVTGDEIELVDLADQPLPLEAGDWLLLASDGLLTLGSGQIAGIIEKEAATGAECVAEAMIAAVRSKADEAQDNTTLIVIGFDCLDIN